MTQNSGLPRKGLDFSVVWGGAAPLGEQALNLTHTREHMIDHLHILGPGAMRRACKYMDGDGDLPKFMTLYEMGSIDALLAPIYGLPPEADRSDRSDRGRVSSPFSRDWLRHNCRFLAEAGGGLGGALAVFVIQFIEPLRSAAEHSAQIAALVTRPCVTAARLGLSDPVIRGIPGRDPGPRVTADEPIGVMMVESYTRMGLAQDMRAVEDQLKTAGLARRVLRRGLYALSYAISSDDIVDEIKLPLGAERGLWPHTE